MAKGRRAKGDGSIVKRADGLLMYSLDLGKDAKTGKRNRRTLYARTKTDLKRKVADLRARGGGTIKPRAVGTVGEWIERWLRDDVKPNRGSNTYALYESMWRVHAAPIIGGRSLERFDVEDVQALYTRLRDDGASASVIQRVGVVLHRAIAVAIRQRIYMRANPFALVEKPKHEAKEARVLTIEESRRLLAAAKGQRFGALWTLLLTAGLRLGEALALEWADVDFQGRAIAVKRSLIEVNGYVEIGPTKTKGSRRRVDIGKLALSALKTRKTAAAREGHGSSLVFSTLDGTPMRRSNLRRDHFTPVCAAAKIKGLTIHGLRHSMTSLALAGGIPTKIVAERLGHSTTRLTQDRYAHVLPGLQREAAERLDALVRARPSTKKATRKPG